jgi:hypothetical protein
MIEVRTIPSAEAVQRRRQPIDPGQAPGQPFLTNWDVSIRLRGDVVSASLREKWSRRMPDTLSRRPEQSGLYRVQASGFEAAPGGREHVREMPLPPCRHNVCAAWYALMSLAAAAIGEDVLGGKLVCQVPMGSKAGPTDLPDLPMDELPF